MWNPNDDAPPAPPNFMADLYGDDVETDYEEEDVEVEDVEVEEVDEEIMEAVYRGDSPVAPPYSPLTSPSPRRGSSPFESVRMKASCSRSRSPSPLVEQSVRMKASCSRSRSPSPLVEQSVRMKASCSRSRSPSPLVEQSVRMKASCSCSRSPSPLVEQSVKMEASCWRSRSRSPLVEQSVKMKASCSRSRSPLVEKSVKMEASCSRSRSPLVEKSVKMEASCSRSRSRTPLVEQSVKMEASCSRSRSPLVERSVKMEALCSRSRSRTPLVEQSVRMKASCSRSRSRSPLVEQSSGKVLAIYTEDGVKMDDTFFDPDSHVLFESVSERRLGESSSGVISVKMEASCSRSRSRSPLVEQSSGIVLAIYTEDGVKMDDTFFDPDSHVLFESVSERRLGESSSGVIGGGGVDRVNRGRSLRGRVRGRRGGRARSRGQSRGRGGGSRRRLGTSWQPGHPLEEVWVTDDDVPPELRVMVRDVVRRRQARVGDLEARRRNARVSGDVKNEGNNSESENDDVYEDASDGRGNPLLEGVDLHFDWSPMETFRGVEESFIPEQTGSTSLYTSPYDAFRSYWDDGILQTIVDETNWYASRIKSASFQSDWYETNVHELMCLFAFWMMTGIIRMPTIVSYFSNNELLRTNVFSRITTLKRYCNLHRALNFAHTSLTDRDSASPTNTDDASSYRLHGLKPIIDHLNCKFQSNYVLSKDICIDESLTLWKGRLKFKQYIRSKAAKFGIKTFELCESATGYLWSFVVYTGKETGVDTGITKSTAIVIKLIKPLLQKGYRLFLDNWFNSPLLARFLKRNRTDCVGTLRASRVDVPKSVTQLPLKQGQLVARHSGDVCVLSWLDKKRINMISTCHGVATGLPSVSSRPPVRPEPFKPQSVLDYNRSMGGVDLKDQMLEPYLLERKRCAKWYLKFFKRLLNCSIHNSRILLESSLKARQDNLTFRLELVHAILSHHHSHIPLGRRAESFHRRSQLFPYILRLTHWPVRVAQTENDRANNRNSRQRCVICLQEGRKNQRTHFKCEECDVPLCVENCFKKHHTVLA